jgi:hypothetical protein
MSYNSFIAESEPSRALGMLQQWVPIPLNPKLLIATAAIGYGVAYQIRWQKAIIAKQRDKIREQKKRIEKLKSKVPADAEREEHQSPQNLDQRPLTEDEINEVASSLQIKISDDTDLYELLRTTLTGAVDPGWKLARTREGIRFIRGSGRKVGDVREFAPCMEGNIQRIRDAVRKRRPQFSEHAMELPHEQKERNPFGVASVSKLLFSFMNEPSGLSHS